MYIQNSLHFIYNDETYLQDNFQISRKEAIHCVAGICRTVKWLEASIFKEVLDDVRCHITDEPINFPGELVINEGEPFEPIIYMNVMAITEDFQNKEYVIDLKKNTATCFEYASFILLHEVGHYIHALIGGRGKNKREKLFDYFDGGQYYYNRYMQKMVKGISNKEKKMYRNIPHEKAADQFAMQYVQEIPIIRLDSKLLTCNLLKMVGNRTE
ncbi:hypothetical protein [Halalkalibacter krulwichiae]|uniref:Uncharacterized protein n=1 Tax=Halalkalibacter krulwichiae TaxID=199441 RepID=A0A1X9MAU6_9BACI|nr:hypothetical protein [Halalkalibacter krulwichiae]ARK30537.1 hypothetical protein BkAM31D_12240 [Halalkalibacter krulwichiae]